MRWYTSWREAKKQRDLIKLNIRIAQLTEAIEGIDDAFWPEIWEQLKAERARLAWRRSDLINELGES